RPAGAHGAPPARQMPPGWRLPWPGPAVPCARHRAAPTAPASSPAPRPGRARASFPNHRPAGARPGPHHRWQPGSPPPAPAPAPRRTARRRLQRARRRIPRGPRGATAWPGGTGRRPRAAAARAARGWRRNRACAPGRRNRTAGCAPYPCLTSLWFVHGPRRPGLDQVGGGFLFPAPFQRHLLAHPGLAPLGQGVLARLRANPCLAGLVELTLSRGQALVGLLQVRLLHHDALAQQADVGLALLHRHCPGLPRRRRVKQALAMRRALDAKRVDAGLDPRALLATGAGSGLLLQHVGARQRGAVGAQLDQGLQRVALHRNNLRSASAESSKPASSLEPCWSSLRMGPIFSIATSASGSDPRLYSPSCSSISMSLYLARYLRSWPAARWWASSTTRGIVRLRLVSTSMAG